MPRWMRSSKARFGKGGTATDGWDGLGELMNWMDECFRETFTRTLSLAVVTSVETVLYIAMYGQQSPASVKQGGGIWETRNVRVSQDFRCKTQRLERYFTWTENCWTSCY